MDVFDTCLFQELTKQYAKIALSPDEQEELYIRFGNLDHLEEVKPYLYAMRYLGWGTKAEPEQVMQELKQVPREQAVLAGLYQDLMMISGQGNALNREKLKDAAGKGYSSVYLKQKSTLYAGVKTADKPASAKPSAAKPANTTTSTQKSPPKPEADEVNILEVALFQSSRSGVQPGDSDRHATRFAARDLDCLYVKARITQPGRQLAMPAYLKIENVTNNTLFYESDYTHTVAANYVAIWKGVYAKSGQWKTGTYRYIWRLGSKTNRGQFVVY